MWLFDGRIELLDYLLMKKAGIRIIFFKFYSRRANFVFRLNLYYFKFKKLIPK